MEHDEFRKIIREEIRRALTELFSEKRLSDMEEHIQGERYPEHWPRRFEYQIDRLSFFTDRLAFLSMKFEDWGNDCVCKYSESDIKHIKDTIDKL
jgi:hypothetical protein